MTIPKSTCISWQRGLCSPDVSLLALMLPKLNSGLPDPRTLVLRPRIRRPMSPMDGSTVNCEMSVVARRCRNVRNSMVKLFLLRRPRQQTMAGHP